MGSVQDDFEIRLRDAKLAALAEFAAGAGHEINNPVATIVGRAQQLLQVETDPSRRQALATIVAQAFRIRDMIGDLMLFARPPSPQPSWFEVQSAIREAIEPFRQDFAEQQVSIRLEGDDGRIFFDPVQFQVAFSELIKNALSASHNRGQVKILVSRSAALVEIAVVDDGAGFGEMDLEHAFDPFYSGREAGRGLGFGLSKVWRIMTLSGGTVHATSEPGKTEVRLTIPLSVQSQN